jgi:fluoroquinolone resistance protein
MREQDERVDQRYEENPFPEGEDREFDNIVFRRCSFERSNLKQVRVLDCEFETCSLSSVSVDDAVLQATFIDSKIEGVNFFTAKRELMSLSFERCLIRYSSFAMLRLQKTKFIGCTLQFVDFADADLKESDFSNSAFEDCVFQNTILSKADFRGARGYTIDPTLNTVTQARFNVPDVLGLLSSFNIRID